jgi:hypothetical protein
MREEEKEVEGEREIKNVKNIIINFLNENLYFSIVLITATI